MTSGISLFKWALGLLGALGAATLLWDQYAISLGIDEFEKEVGELALKLCDVVDGLFVVREGYIWVVEHAEEIRRFLKIVASGLATLSVASFAIWLFFRPTTETPQAHAPTSSPPQAESLPPPSPKPPETPAVAAVVPAIPKATPAPSPPPKQLSKPDLHIGTSNSWLLNPRGLTLLREADDAFNNGHCELVPQIIRKASAVYAPHSLNFAEEKNDTPEERKVRDTIKSIIVRYELGCQQTSGH